MGETALSHDPQVETFRIGGVPVSAITMAGLIAALDRRLEPGTEPRPGAFVVFRDAHGIVRAQDEPRLRAAHESALLVCPDGRPLVWIGRLRGAALEQVPGMEAVEAVCRAGLARGWRHYFLGGVPGIAGRLAEGLAMRLPGLQVAGTETPPFRPLTAEEAEAMRGRIRASGAQIVWVGLGTPKQELWMDEHAPHLPGTVSMGIGAAFDVQTGRVRRAPRLLQVSGLEWLYRLSQEPGRLGRRYAEVIPRFLLLAALELSARGRRP